MKTLDATILRGHWELNPARSLAGISIPGRPGESHYGWLRQVGGRIALDGVLPGVSFLEIDLDARIMNANSERWEPHPELYDFLDPRVFPRFGFRSRRIHTAAEGGHLRVFGELRMRDVRRLVVAEATIHGVVADPDDGRDRLRLVVNLSFDPAEFGLDWLDMSSDTAERLASIQIDAEGDPLFSTPEAA